MELNLVEELKKELLTTESWFDQFVNVLYTLLCGFGTWLWLTITLASFYCIQVVLAIDGSTISFNDFQDDFRGVVIISCAISALAVFVFGLPRKFRNVFKDIAQDRVDRYNDINDNIQLIESIVDKKLKQAATPTARTNETGT